MKRIVFSTKVVESITKKIDEGFIISNAENPYYDKKVGLRKDKLTFKMTKEEQDEYIKCKLDVKYFANNYCKVKTEDGTYDIIKLRDYQYEILDMLQNPSNKFNIIMASRQVGKCVDLTTKVILQDNNIGELVEVPIYEIYFKYKKDRTLYDKIKFRIYKWIDKFSSYR